MKQVTVRNPYRKPVPVKGVMLLPGEALNDERRFIDDASWEQVAGALAPAVVIEERSLVGAFGTR